MSTEGEAIKYSDLVVPGTFEKFASDSDALLEHFKKLEEGIKAAMAPLKQKLSGNVVTVKDLNEQAAAVDKTRAAYEGQIVVLREKQKIEQENYVFKQKEKAAEKELAEEKKRIIKLAAQEKDAYQKLSAEHRALVKEAKALAVTYGEESKQARNAAKAANELDAQLKKIDASVGQHQRNVGNYSSALKGLGSEMMSAFGITLGAAAIVGGLKSSVSAFVDAEKNAHSLEFALTNVAKEGKAAFDTLIRQSEELQARGGIFSDDDIQKSQTQLVNFGLYSNEIEALEPKILDLASTLKVDLGTATDIVIKGLNGQTKGLKAVGLDFKDTGNVIDNYNVILGKLDKFQGAAIASTETMEGKYQVLMNRFDEFQESIGEFLVDTGFGFLQWYDEATGKVSSLTAAMDRQSEAFNRQREEALALARTQIIDPKKTKEEQLAELNATTRLILADIEDAKAAFDAANVATTDPRWEDLADDRENAILRQQRLNEELSVYVQIQDEILHPEKYEKGPRTFNTDKDAVQKQADTYVYTWEMALKELADFEEKMRQDEENRAKRRLSIEEKLRALELQNASDTAKETARYMDQLKELDLLKEQAQAEGIFDQERYDRDLEAIEKTHLENLEALQEEADRKEKEAKDKKAKEDEERRRKELQDSLSNIRQITDAVSRGLDQRYRAEQDAADFRIDLIDSELQTQTTLFTEGLENNLDAQKALRAKATEEALALARKAEKEKRAIELSNTYISFVQSYLKEGKDAKTAATEALAQTLIVQGIVDAISGNYKDGVENLEGPGTETSDSIIARLSKGESVATAKATRENPGLITAINEDGYAGAVDWAMENIYKPNFSSVIASDESGGKANSDYALILQLNTTIEKSIERGFSKMKITTYSKDALGKILEEEMQNGISKKFIHHGPIFPNTNRVC